MCQTESCASYSPAEVRDERLSPRSPPGNVLHRSRQSLRRRSPSYDCQKESGYRTQSAPPETDCSDRHAYEQDKALRGKCSQGLACWPTCTGKCCTTRCSLFPIVQVSEPAPTSTSPASTPPVTQPVHIPPPPPLEVETPTPTPTPSPPPLAAPVPVPAAPAADADVPVRPAFKSPPRR
jgi:hypothetical protein